MKIKVFILVIFVSIFSCSSKLSNNEIRNIQWKYGDGFHISDLIIFNQRIDFNEGTIYLKKKPVALIKKCFKRNDNQYVMEIISLENSQIGTYYGKFNINP